MKEDNKKKTSDFSKFAKAYFIPAYLRHGFDSLTPIVLSMLDKGLLQKSMENAALQEKKLLEKKKEVEAFNKLAEDLVTQIVCGMVDQNGCNAIMATVYRLYPELAAKVNLAMIVQNAYLEKQRREHPPIKLIQNEYNSKVETVNNTLDLDVLKQLGYGGEEID